MMKRDIHENTHHSTQQSVDIVLSFPLTKEYLSISVAIKHTPQAIRCSIPRYIQQKQKQALVLEYYLMI